MSLTIALNSEIINHLDLSPINEVITQVFSGGNLSSYEQQLNFKINYNLAPNDPREFSEIPEIRLWFVRLDTVYPWMPFLLDWKVGELVRYAAMLVPHQFHPTEGIQYNPEALEIFVMQKVFTLSDWLQKNDVKSQFRLKSMAQLFGYELDDAFFALINSQ